MTLRFFDTLSGTLRDFEPLRPGEVGMYTCGPTVHDFQHIGNYRTFLFEDLLRRHLRGKRYRVVQVMNLTDVDDKIIRKAAAKHMTIGEYTAVYTEAFFQDLRTLNIEPAEVYPRATDHVGDMVTLIERLMEKGHAYELDGSIYFRIASFPPYGRLAKLDPKGLKAGARVDADEYDKEDVRDFVLWKAPREGDPVWDTRIGRGRPGWSIECSAMSMKYLGESFDIHTGGVDNIFPHHENEIAQSEAATGKPFVRYWLHAEHLQMTGEKMAKSLGNFTTVRDALAEGYQPRAIRYALLTGAQYRRKLNFSPDMFGAAESALRRLDDFVARVRAVPDSRPGEPLDLVSPTQAAWEAALDDDLNLPVALGHLFDLVHEVNRLIESGSLGAPAKRQVLELLGDVDRILGVLRLEEQTLDAEVERLIAEREAARTSGNFQRADSIRADLARRGILLEDTKQGVRWKRTGP
jgi:cysteinyl-tRNA synthetase